MNSYKLYTNSVDRIFTPSKIFGCDEKDKHNLCIFCFKRRLIFIFQPTHPFLNVPFCLGLAFHLADTSLWDSFPLGVSIIPILLLLLHGSSIHDLLYIWSTDWSSPFDIGLISTVINFDNAKFQSDVVTNACTNKLLLRISDGL